MTGRFADVQGTISLDEQDPASARAEVTIGAACVDTRMAKRDQHLRKADFFDVERHPTLTFTSRRIETIDRRAGHYRVVGDLTVRGVTREVQLDATASIPAARDGSGRRIKLTLASGPRPLVAAGRLDWSCGATLCRNRGSDLSSRSRDGRSCVGAAYSGRD